MKLKDKLQEYTGYIAAGKKILFEKKKEGIQRLRFYKTERYQKWYVDYPSWPGAIANLEMVAGADTWLDMLSNNGDEVTIDVSLDASDITNAEMIHLINKGGDYEVRSYEGEKCFHQLWLCGVTLFVFNRVTYPNTIYYKVVN